MTNEELWQSALGEIELNISQANFMTWFKNTGIASKSENGVIIYTPNAFSQEWLKNKYSKFILRALRNISQDIKEIEYIIGCPDKQQLLTRESGDKSANKNHHSENQLGFKEFNIDPETNLNPKYILDSFVVGSSNELAHAAATSVIKNLGSLYNPLFIYGGVGLGKTHLIQAIGNESKKLNPLIKVFYVSSNKFSSELISAIQNKTVEDFKKNYRKIDLLIIDDIQFLAGREKTQEEFFHIFNDLYGKNKQIIISSDKPPKSISTIEERLKSRFEGGMMADISYPDFETRLAILKSKAIEKNINLDEETFSFIANSFQKNIRELEGALNRVIAEVKLKNLNNPTPEEIKKIITSLSNSNKKSLNLKYIIKTVADFYEIPEKDLLNRSRKKEIVKCRQILMYILREELSLSYPYIGRKLGGRDHTTAIHAYGKITADMKINNLLREEFNLIKEKLYN